MKMVLNSYVFICYILFGFREIKYNIKSNEIRKTRSCISSSKNEESIYIYLISAEYDEKEICEEPERNKSCSITLYGLTNTQIDTKQEFNLYIRDRENENPSNYDILNCEIDSYGNDSKKNYLGILFNVTINCTENITSNQRVNFSSPTSQIANSFIDEKIILYNVKHSTFNEFLDVYKGGIEKIFILENLTIIKEPEGYATYTVSLDLNASWYDGECCVDCEEAPIKDKNIEINFYETNKIINFDVKNNTEIDDDCSYIYNLNATKITLKKTYSLITYPYVRNDTLFTTPDGGPNEYKLDFHAGDRVAEYPGLSSGKIAGIIIAATLIVISAAVFVLVYIFKAADKNIYKQEEKDEEESKKSQDDNTEINLRD